MRSIRLCALILVAGVTLVAGSIESRASDYGFLPTPDTVTVGDAAVDVRVIADGQPVTRASVVRVRLDMSPSGLLTTVGETQYDGERSPGVYHFRIHTTHAGRWQLALTLSIPGESHTILGFVGIRARK